MVKHDGVEHKLSVLLSKSFHKQTYFNCTIKKLYLTIIYGIGSSTKAIKNDLLMPCKSVSLDIS